MKWLAGKGSQKARHFSAINLMNFKYITVFFGYKTHFSPNLEGNGGASYSPNVAYIYIGEILCYLCY